MPNQLPTGPAPAGLHFIADEDAAMGADDPLDDLEVFLGHRDETAHALDRFGDESDDACAGGATDELFRDPARISLRTRDR